MEIIELDALIIQYQQEKNEDLFQKIYSHYKSKFSNIAFKMKNEDISQELCIALLKAIDTFKLEMNVRFNTYFWKIAQNHLGLLSYYNKAMKRASTLPLLYLDQPIAVDNSFDTVTLSDIIEDTYITQQFNDTFLYIFLEQEVFTVLPELQAQVLQLYLLGYTVQEMSIILNMSTGTVQNKIRAFRSNKNIRQKITDYLERKCDLPRKVKETNVIYSPEWVAQMIKEKLAYNNGGETK